MKIIQFRKTRASLEIIFQSHSLAGKNCMFEMNIRITGKTNWT